MSVPPIRAELDIEASNSCNWKCCFTAPKSPPNVPAVKRAAEIITESKSAVETIPGALSEHYVRPLHFTKPVKLPETVEPDA